MYKEAIQKKLRFPFSGGVCDVEDLFDLSLRELDLIASSLRKDLQQDTLFDKADSKSNERLAYDVVVDVFKTKQAAAQAAEEAAAKQQQKARIREILAQKKEESLKNLSEEELQALLKD